jgi:hypothetical protein
MAATASRMGSSNKGRDVSPRKRETAPDNKTAEGLFALHLAHLMRRRNVSADELAESIDVGRATVFGWLRSDASPQIRLWPGIAAKLNLKDWRKLIPPESFTGEQSE